MGLQDLPQNLRLLCSYGKSVSEICRRAGLNRQQFNKYLSGDSYPSIQNLRRICEYFGVDEYEILLDQKSFREIVNVRPLRFGTQGDPLYQFVDGVARTAGNVEAMRWLLGYYQVYYRWHLRDDMIQCSLTHFSEQKGIYLSKNIEKIGPPLNDISSMHKCHGWAVSSGDRIFIMEQQFAAKSKLFGTMLYAPQTPNFRYIEGLIIGTVSDAIRQIGCYRIVYEYLGRAPDLRAALKRCGVYEADHEAITPFVREHTLNEMRLGEHVFQPR